VEYLGAGGTVLDSFDTGEIISQFGWRRVNDSRAAPTDAETVRVRLIAVRNSGDNNDGYFDNLSLRPASSGNAERFLQIVPRVWTWSNNNDFAPGQFIRFVGSGFIEGQSTINFGATAIVDPDVSTTTINVHNTNQGFDVYLPSNPGSEVTIETPGGISDTLIVNATSFTEVIATANNGTPADADAPSANIGQLITINGTGFRTTTNVYFPTVNDSGTVGVTNVRVSSVNVEGTEATVIVPINAATGHIGVYGTDDTLPLQIVPRLTGYSGTLTPGINMTLSGSGFVEGAITVEFGSVSVLDPDTSATTINVFSNGSTVNVIVPTGAEPNVRVITAGGTSEELVIQ
jgi:hypothetical protein